MIGSPSGPEHEHVGRHHRGPRRALRDHRRRQRQRDDREADDAHLTTGETNCLGAWTRSPGRFTRTSSVCMRPSSAAGVNPIRY